MHATYDEFDQFSILINVFPVCIYCCCDLKKTLIKKHFINGKNWLVYFETSEIDLAEKKLDQIVQTEKLIENLVIIFQTGINRMAFFSDDFFSFILVFYNKMSH